jgi:hypothetical protein
MQKPKVVKGKRKRGKKLTIHNKVSFDATNVVKDLRKSLNDKEEAVATDTRERDSLVRYLAEVERAANEMAQALSRYVQTQRNLSNELKVLSTRLTGKLEAVTKKLKPDKRSRISRIVDSVEKDLDDQSARLKSSESEVQTASRKYVISKERADETDEEKRTVLELLGDKSKELNQARDLQGRIETAEARNPELALALSLELKQLLTRLKDPSTSAFEKKLKSIWMKWREDHEVLRQAALARDAAVARYEREKANFAQAVKDKSTSIENALTKPRSTDVFQRFLTLTQK